MSKHGICKTCGCESKSIFKHEKFCKRIQDFLKENSLDKEKIQKEYEQLGSVLNFVKKYGSEKYKQDFIYKVFKSLNINYSLSKSSTSKQCKEKRKKTLIEKYGYEHNFSNGSSSRKAMEQRYFEKYGVYTPLENPKVKQKIENTMIEKYGSVSSLRIRQSGSSISKLNYWLYNLLEKNNINYGTEFIIKNNSKKYSFDVILENKKLIEINGDYWHGNPIIYKPNDIILKGSSGELLVKEKWENDKIKIDSALQFGYTVLVVWELDLKNKEEETIQRIINYARS